MSRDKYSGGYYQPDHVSRNNKDLENPSGPNEESSQFFGRNKMPAGKNKATVKKMNIKPTR